MVFLQGTKQEWQTVFFISASFFIFGGVIFAVFARGEIQPWAIPVKTMELLVNDVTTVENGVTPSEEKSPLPDDDYDGKGGLEEGEKIISNGQCNLETTPLNKCQDEKDDNACNDQLLVIGTDNNNHNTRRKSCDQIQ